MLSALIGSLLTAAPSSAEEPVLVVHDLEYDRKDGEPLLLDVYYTAHVGTRPVVLLVHGGSWRRGDKSDWSKLALRFAGAGYTVLVPNYRLAPRGGSTLFPGPAEDLESAVSWTRSNVHIFGGDRTRVGMLGTSAGGHLSLLAATARDHRPDAVAIYSAPVNLRRLFKINVLRERIRNFLGCSPAVCPTTYSAANPSLAIDGATPPTFLAYSLDELVPYRHGTVMSARLREAGVPHTLHIRPGEEHGRGLMRRMMTETLGFLQENL